MPMGPAPVSLWGVPRLLLLGIRIVTATLVLHELTAEAHPAVAREMLRVVTDEGSIVVVDFHLGPLRGSKGRMMGGTSVIAELMARHLRRSRAFVAGGGVPALAAQLGMGVRETKVLAGGNLADLACPYPAPTSPCTCGTGPPCREPRAS